MDTMMIQLNKDRPLYLQIYEHIKSSIISGVLKEREALPSIRRLAATLSVSKITVERAYDQLFSEGYIEGAERSRFAVATLSESYYLYDEKKQKQISYDSSHKKEEISYDFSSGEMDAEGFDFFLWRKYMSRALLDGARLMKYGEICGEVELRQQIAKYLMASRGVVTSAEQIIIGSNTQVLIGQLCTLFDPKQDKIAFENPGFKNGRRVFFDYGFEIVPIEMTPQGLDESSLRKSTSKAVFVSPSHQFPTGLIMPAPRRISLLNWAYENNSYIIEDDYDSEYRYYGNPIPAMKGMDQSDRVIYIGSFSKIIPPSIRISYMVLPENLMEKYRGRESHYSQTASAIEQMTLSLYMEDGQLERQIRRLKKIYSEKRRLFISNLKDAFGDDCKIYDNSSGLFVILEPKFKIDRVALKEAGRKNGCRISCVEDFLMEKSKNHSSKIRLILYFSSIKSTHIPDAVQALKSCLYFSQTGLPS